MTLHQMNLFLAVCNYSSLTEAAEAVHISQPSLSVAIKQLEEEFGVSLFYRYRKRLVLTDEGKIFRDEATKIVESASRLESRMADIGKTEPKVHIGISAMASMLFYPRYIVPFCNENPSIRVEMHELSGADAVQHIAENRLNLALVNHTAITSDDLEFIPLAQSAIVGCVRKDHRLACKTSVSLDMLAGEKLVFSGEKSNTTQQILQGLQKAGIDAQVFMYSHQFLLMLQVIERFGAVGFFFEDLIAQSPNYAPFYLKDPFVYRHGLVRRKSATLLKNEMKFLKYCEAHKKADMDLPTERPMSE